MHFKILDTVYTFFRRKILQKSSKIFWNWSGAGTRYWSRISRRNRIQPDIWSVPNVVYQIYKSFELLGHRTAAFRPCQRNSSDSYTIKLIR